MVKTCCFVLGVSRQDLTCRPSFRQHMRNCTLTGNQLYQDILSYSLPLIGCSDSSSDEDISVATG